MKLAKTKRKTKKLPSQFDISSDLNDFLSSLEIPVLIISSDLTVQSYSPAAQSIFNLLPTDIGRSVSEIDTKIKVDFTAHIGEVISALGSNSIEVKDSRGRWLRLQFRPYRTSANFVAGAIVTVIDIDRIKKRELKTQGQLEYVIAVAEAVPFPVAVIDHLQKIQTANLAFCNFFSSSGPLIGKDVFKVFEMQDGDLDDLKKLLIRSTKEDLPVVDYQIDFNSICLGAKKILLSARKIHWSKGGNEASLISFYDITKQRLLEAEQEQSFQREQESRIQADRANQAKDIFLANLSHELRTPLSSILTWAQLIQRGKVDFDQAKEGASVIEKSAKIQSRLIDDLLDISRVISGKLSMQIQAIDPVGPTRLAIELTRPLAEKRGIQLLINLSQGTHEILADATRVQQIVWNLLSNAVKFSPKGSVIQVDLKYVKELGREYAELKVTDEGKGIPPDFLPRIFNRFSQADNASTRQFGGLGLGLSIAQNLVELQGGTLRAENRLRESGAIFTVLFPLISERSRAIVQSKESETAVPSDSLRAAVRLDELPNLSGVRVLIVDDDESTLDAIAIFIKSFGADVLAVQSGEAAIKGLSTFIADVLVSDIAMPGEDGYSLIRRIRKSEKESNTYLPAIALTAFASPRDIENALQAGFQCHLPKPVEANDLGRKIQGLARSPSNTST